jgi:predicted flap endonuclease-1-like 5' DNA nuclease
MTLSFLPELPQIDPEKGPNLMAGAASPLWLMFGGAAMAGATWWWWSTRWREAVNVEALMTPALTATLPEPVELAPEPAVAAPIDPVAEAPILAPVDLEAPTPIAAAEPVAEAAFETAETAVETAVETAKSVADDLTQLVGIGPKLAASLSDLGVTRFEQIAAWGAEDLADFDAKLSLRGRAERDAWVAQAKRLAAGA